MRLSVLKPSDDHNSKTDKDKTTNFCLLYQLSTYTSILGLKKPFRSITYLQKLINYNLD